MVKTAANHDITYDLASEDKDWRHRMALRQQSIVNKAEHELQTHMNLLRINHIEAYQHWCIRQGFAPVLGKNQRQLKRERKFHALLSETENHIYDPSLETASAIHRVYNGQLNATDPPFLNKIHAGFANAPDGDTRDVLLKILCHLDQYVDLSYEGVIIPKLNENTFVQGLIALAYHHRDFIRPVEAWQTTVENPRDLVATLSRHLLSPLGVPRFMDAAWFRADLKLAARQQEWFKHIAKGFSICSANAPPRLTSRMGDAFVHAHENLTIEEAMRYAQIVGQGGDDRLAEAIVDTPLGMSFRNSVFLDTVLTYFVSQKQLSRTCVGAVLDFLEAQRFERPETVQPDGSIIREKPTQPKLTIEGRSVAKLLREAEAWQLHLSTDDKRTSAMTRWCLREEILRRSYRKGTRLARTFLDPVKHFFSLGMENNDAYRDWCKTRGFAPTIYKTWEERRRELDAVTQDMVAMDDADAVDDHIAVLGLPSRTAYKTWCKAQNFSDALRKSRGQQRREIRLMERLKGETVLATARREMQQPQQMVTAIYEGNINKQDLTTDVLITIAESFEAYKDDSDTRDALYTLLIHVNNVAQGLLSQERAINALGNIEGNTFLEGVIALASRHRDWIGDPKDWRPGKYSNARRQFSSLARHLLAKYDVPIFMDSAWFLRGAEAHKQQDWFLHIGLGQNIRTADIPLHLTKMMAHRFLEAPNHFSVTQAFRYGQILGQNGSGALMRAVLETRLGRSFKNEDFWQTVILFLVNSPMLDPDYVHRIINYIFAQKYADQQITHPDGRVETFPPPHPRFSMRGRSRIKLIRQVDRWLGFGKAAEKIVKNNWSSSGFEGFTHTEMDTRTGLNLNWRIVEIRTIQDLVSEGREMRHCVGSYAGRCQRGGTSVWSLQVGVDNEKPRRVMTIAVNNKSKSVSQSRGKFNADHWVEEEGDGPEGRNVPRRARKLNRHDRMILMRSNRVLGMWLRQEGIRLV